MGPPPPGVRGGQPSPQQPVIHRGQKRSSTSPDDVCRRSIPFLTRFISAFTLFCTSQLPGDTPKDQSPPERKRQRQSPQGAPGAADSSMAQPPMSSMSGYSPNPAGYMGPQGMPNGFRPSQMGGPMGPHPGQPMANMGPMNMGGVPPNLGHPMPPGMAPPMNPALANQHLHQMPGQVCPFFFFGNGYYSRRLIILLSHRSNRVLSLPCITDRICHLLRCINYLEA